jgi:hypothetical protein
MRPGSPLNMVAGLPVTDIIAVRQTPAAAIARTRLMNRIRIISRHREPPGLERTILAKLPRYTVGGIFVAALVPVLGRRFPIDAAPPDLAKHIFMLDAFAIGLTITWLTAMFTIAIGCCVVVVMKGPHYAADSYPINDASRPDPDRESR